ncbi:MAG: TRAP transporter substrate-binding protein DctP [Deltaproteobacteria bacterium]|nr:TRAP transporter substrate-binding protein DctP [Deltaproteobacteria bacterium]
MKRLAAGKRVLFFAIALMAAATLAAGPASAQQAPIKWKAQTLWNAQETPQKTFEDFCKRVKVLTNGRLEIEPYPAGAIVPTNETLTALQSNVLQAIHVWPGYASGRNPAFAALCDFIFAYESPWELDVFMHYKGGLELLRELYKPFGAYTVGVMVWGLESWPSKKPIRNMEDFKGLKIREPQGMESEFMAKAGASVVVLPGTEIFSALDKGVVDATNWATASINDKTGFHQVAPYFTYPGFHSMPVGDFTVRQQEWDKLPADIKQILTTACREWAWDTIERVAIEDAKLVSEAKSKGYTPIAWTPEERAKARKIAMEIWQGWKGKNEQTKRAIEMQEAWLRELGRIQ